MVNFKDINCRIVNIHGHICCQTGVRVSIFSLCRRINRVQYMFKSTVSLLSTYVYCINAKKCEFPN